jgi:hypothetical protein
MSEEKDEKVEPGIRMSDEDLRDFVLGLCDGRVFTSAHIRNDHDIGMVFMPLKFGALRYYHPKEIDQIGVIWEYRDKAGPMDVNGMPSFFSCRIMHKDDWKRAVKAYEKENERRKGIEL